MIAYSLSGKKGGYKMEKSFKEVIRDIKKGEVWEGWTYSVRCTEETGNIIIEDLDGDARYAFTILTTTKFKLK